MTDMMFVRTARLRESIGVAALGAIACLLSGCTILPGAGPSTRAVANVSKDQSLRPPIAIVDVTDGIAQRLRANGGQLSFKDGIGDGISIGSIVGRGDTLDISIWEAPPAALFGSTTGGNLASADGTTLSVSRPSALPEQVVGTEGTIRVPFAGSIAAAGRTTDAIATEIRSRLIGKAHDPQVVVRLVRNATSNVTVVGEVTNSLRMPLTAKGERLLDALASAGGVRQPVGKMTIQVTRADKVEAMPLEAVIKDPRQNIRLQADDVVTLLFQPYSFTVLGAARINQEIPFEGTGLTLSQALGRMGGLDDQRANPKGVFIFRFEDPKIFEGSGSPVATTKDGKIPVIYRVNMRDPTTLFVAQSFPIEDKDVIYVSNAPLADFAKFLQAVSQIVYPIAVIQTTNIF
jgi:polysaccharide export outer membrane protein